MSIEYTKDDLLESLIKINVYMSCLGIKFIIDTTSLISIFDSLVPRGIIKINVSKHYRCSLVLIILSEVNTAFKISKGLMNLSKKLKDKETTYLIQNKIIEIQQQLLEAYENICKRDQRVSELEAIVNKDKATCRYCNSDNIIFNKMIPSKNMRFKYYYYTCQDCNEKAYIIENAEKKY
ncbi:hypothetical protein [Francisella sp. SYW-9]|uniref:hypothetical protein n=1 Tax=Francisella sp. SYW-9 TaxID=2610888 RepID=UPI00123D1024|nr:hypothetical protein [Francisella sp. SYW-9]